MSWEPLTPSDHPDLPKVGSKVHLIGDHPWSNHAGVVKSHETIGVFSKEGARVELDNGRTCFVFGIEHWSQA